MRDYPADLDFNIHISVDVVMYRGNPRERESRFLEELRMKNQSIIFTVLIIGTHANVSVGIGANICPITGGTKRKDWTH